MVIGIKSNQMAQKLGFVGGIRLVFPEAITSTDIGKVQVALGKESGGLKVNQKTMNVYYPEGKREVFTNALKEAFKENL